MGPGEIGKHRVWLGMTWPVFAAKVDIPRGTLLHWNKHGVPPRMVKSLKISLRKIGVFI